MKVVKAQTLGFCMGVRRAVDIAVDAAKNNEKVFTLGHLIHNPKVLDDLKNLGLQIVDESLLSTPDSQLPTPCSVIIRAHGIAPLLEKKISNCNVIDATCPKVKANQLKTRELVNDGYFIFLAGKSHHAEIEGLVGYAASEHGDSSCVIIGNVDEARSVSSALYDSNKEKNINSFKTALLGQTTISEEEYEKIGNEIKKYFPDLKIINTICSATRERQNALREMLSQVEAVIIAGGKESANTRLLLEIAKESGKSCVLVECADNIPTEFFKYKIIGISAGASTPDSIVEEIEKKLL